MARGEIFQSKTVQMVKYWSNICPIICQILVKYWSKFGNMIKASNKLRLIAHFKVQGQDSPYSLCTNPNPISVRRRGHSRLSTIAQRGGLVGGSFFLIFSNRFSFSHIYHTLLFFAPMLVLALIQERSCAQHTTLMRYICVVCV